MCSGPKVHPASAWGTRAEGEGLGLAWAGPQSHKRGLRKMGPMTVGDANPQEVTRTLEGQNSVCDYGSVYSVCPGSGLSQ